MTLHIVSSGVTSSGFALQPGNSLMVLSGGVATDSLVNSGASYRSVRARPCRATVFPVTK